MTGAGVRIGNASGFYGDRESAVREMLTGGDLHYLTGDYLAELTMLILAMDRLKDPGRGFARSFLRQMEEGLGLALDAGVKVVVNAGGLNPAALAAALREQAERLGLTASVAHVEGDDLLPRAAELGLAGPGGAAPLAANHADRLDEALIRAGRIDERVELGLCDEEQLRRLYLKFDPDEVAALAFAAEFAPQGLSPAQVQGRLMRRFGATSSKPPAPPGSRG